MSNNADHVVFNLYGHPHDGLSEYAGLRSLGAAAPLKTRTGSRRMLEYVFSPLVKVGSVAMKVRQQPFDGRNIGV